MRVRCEDRVVFVYEVPVSSVPPLNQFHETKKPRPLFSRLSFAFFRCCIATDFCPAPVRWRFPLPLELSNQEQKYVCGEKHWDEQKWGKGESRRVEGGRREEDTGWKGVGSFSHRRPRELAGLLQKDCPLYRFGISVTFGGALVARSCTLRRSEPTALANLALLSKRPPPRTGIRRSLT